jgi:uncharacterized protein
MSLSLSHRKKRYKVDLPAQLVECEMNYHRLLRLFHGLKEAAVGNRRHYIVGDHLLSESHFRITLLEQTKYTTVVHIAQLFSLQNTKASIKNNVSESKGDPASVASAKELTEKRVRQEHKESTVYQGDVRLYHDASLAEVVKCQRYQSFSPRYEYPNVDMHQIDEKAQMNRFLGELLTHCLSHGRVADKLVFSS